MFPGMFQPKPDKATAMKQLGFHVTIVTSFVATIRAAPPYVLQYFQKDELTLDF